MGDGGLKKNTETWTLMYRAQSRTYGVKKYRPSNAYLHMHVYNTYLYNYTLECLDGISREKRRKQKLRQLKTPEIVR